MVTDGNDRIANGGGSSLQQKRISNRWKWTWVCELYPTLPFLRAFISLEPYVRCDAEFTFFSKGHSIGVD